ncbi:MAG: hypothetical protein ABIS67_15545 [Candidatus Eisenbacteria bacterium]
MSRPSWPRWTAPLLFALGLLALYWSSLGTGFLNDDYLFLEEARTRPLASALTRLDALGNYYRPLSRQIYFALLSPIAGGDASVFHAVNFAIFLAALALLADLLAVFVTGPALGAGLLFFALLPFQRVNLTWISCSQDLLALLFSLAALALWRRELRGVAVAAYVAAIASKEAALPLPLAFAAWDLWIARRPSREVLRRQLPLVAAAVAWAAIVMLVRSRSARLLVLRFDADGIPATFAHMVQSLLGVEHPPGFLGAFARHFPEALPLALLGAAGVVAVGFARRAGLPPPLAPDRRAPIRFAFAWLGLFTLVTWPVVHIWCGYYYTLAAVGAAMLVGLVARRLDRLGWVALCAGLLWWHAAGTGTRAFAVENKPWGWTSHLTTFYFERGAALADSISRNLRALEPSPGAGTRFFFATLPPWAGFQMGNGALLRTLYRDSSLQSHFYSQFSDSTAADQPCRFYHWDGAALRPLYPGLDNPFFQVGCDLLLLDRPAGAAHAFRRSLAAGGSHEDNLYWLGWAALWNGNRPGAEAAWSAFGARDEPALHARLFAAVRSTLYERRDTLTARRQLLEAIRAGIGLPHPHAALGELLLARGGVETKYGLLELKVATWLNPNDLLARRGLISGLAEIRMDDAARTALSSLQQLHPDWRADPALVRLDGVLERRRSPRADVAAFE